MRKTIASILLFAFIIGFFGFFPLHKFLQYRVRQEIKLQIKQGIPENELHKIVFAINEEPDWEQEGKEFRHNHQMYDVVKKEVTETEVIYYCVNDHEETFLFAQLDKMVKEQMENTNSSTEDLADIFATLSLAYLNEQLRVLCPEFCLDKYNLGHSTRLLSVYLETETPPPNIS